MWKHHPYYWTTISPSDIKDVVLSVLELCEARQLTSFAFPALALVRNCDLIFYVISVSFVCLLIV